MDVFFVFVEEWDYFEFCGYLLVIVRYFSDIGGCGVVIMVNYEVRKFGIYLVMSV